MTNINHNYVEINDIRMHYATAGTGELLIFLHGFPEFWGVWKKQIIAFSKDFQVVAPDMRGYNLTSKPKSVEKYHINYLVSDIKALVDHLGHEKFTLVAQDWGALVAWSFALRHPAYLKKLCVINITHPALFNRQMQENPKHQQASQYMLAFRSSQGENMIMGEDFSWIKQVLLDENIKQGYLTEEDGQAYLEAWLQPGAITGGLNYYRAAELGPPHEDSPGGSNLVADLDPNALILNVPTMVIFGEQDPFLLIDGLEGLDNYVPNLIIRRIPDATHWVTIEKSDLVNVYLKEFILM